MQIEVDIFNIRKNLETIRKLSGSEVCPIVKADAYGHGSVRVCRALEDIACCFATATYGEAKKIVTQNIKKDVLILGADNSNGEDNIIPSIVSLEDYFKKRSCKRVSLIVNTGMNRLGVNMNELKYIDKKDNIFSAFSHVYSKESLENQTKKFDTALDLLKIEAKRHLYASNWVYSKKKYDFIRCGINLYGYGLKGLFPAMRVTAKIIRVSYVKKGENVGYGKCVLDKDMKIATVNTGYRDGFLRKRNDKEIRTVIVNGERCNLVGQVCMDMFMIDVSSVDAKVGDEVCILGNEMCGEEFAMQNSTIVYEILTTFYHREDIIYKND